MRAATHRLVAYDGSAPARHALRRAVELAAPGDVVSVVNVMAEPGVSARIGPPKDRRRQGELLHEAAEYLAERSRGGLFRTIDVRPSRARRSDVRL